MNPRLPASATNRLVVTTSWDDGHPADLRIAALLAKYGIAGTFYVPNRNAEGRPVMEAGDVREVAGCFEIGGHGRDHVILPPLSREAASVQVVENKAWLEDVLGHDVKGFCYVQGRHSPMVASVVRAAGYSYARTATSFRRKPGRDPFLIPATIQLMPHSNASTIRHLLRRGPSPERLGLALRAMRHGDLVRRIDNVIDACRAAPSLFHLWGHSWELEAYGLWPQFEDVLARLASLGNEALFLDNHAAFRAWGLIGTPAPAPGTPSVS